VWLPRQVEGDRVGAEGRAGAVDRGNDRWAARRMKCGKTGSRNQVDVVGVTAAQERVVGADDRETGRLRFFDGDFACPAMTYIPIWLPPSTRAETAVS
jgi:hypothetical protein